MLYLEREQALIELRDNVKRLGGDWYIAEFRRYGQTYYVPRRADTPDAELARQFDEHGGSSDAMD